jgi:hypothetical protein
MSEKSGDLLKKVDNLLGNEKELIILKGMFFSPAMAHTQQGNNPYYSFKLKVLKNTGSDEYGQSFNTYHVIMPSEVAKDFPQQAITAMKNNEVVCLCSANAQVKVLGEKKINVNNISLYCHGLMMTREILRETTFQKAINL